MQLKVQKGFMWMNYDSRQGEATMSGDGTVLEEQAWRKEGPPENMAGKGSRVCSGHSKRSEHCRDQG